MVVLNKNAFRLPRVEKEKFILLLRLGLEYNREQGTFCVSNYNNVEKLTDTIASILNVEEVSFAQACVLCGKDFPCAGCKYYESCATRSLPFKCVCPQCLKKGKPNEEPTKNDQTMLPPE
jgi:hypothetical protein